ncbi:MAG: PaaI family thioesterase [Anaerolineaceae bacterium]|nr:PaaI family thioesterase [Anaerolineaceae bacterium]
MSKDPIVPPGFIAAIHEMQGSCEADGDPIPPVFYEMAGKIVSFDLEQGTLKAIFPIQPRYQNPNGAMQGGMVAAAIDNAFGPLSSLVAPASATMKMEIRYKKPVLAAYEHIIVEAKLDKKTGPFLKLSATVKNNEGEILTTANTVHMILPVSEP